MAQAKSTTQPEDIFEAARAADVEATRQFIDAGADLAACNAYGFTALECAAMGTNNAPLAQSMEVLHMLLKAGSPLEHSGGDLGRTALYLAAEFSPSVDVVRLLLDAGAQPDVRSKDGIHVVENAMMPEVQALLSRLTGYSVPDDEDDEPESQKMSAAQWRAAEQKIATVFQQLDAQGIICLQDAGQTQEDAFDDCSDIFIKRGGVDAGLTGMCFYTRQDQNRAKKSSDLALGFWGAPEGEPADMKRVGQQIVDAFVQAHLPVRWNGSDRTRPIVDLRSI
ncbi:ankyrin repeat domain-containing protein [Diaphorobacter caeni]|uniref:ankyrin repeat domain-containing protein n=1 Tax=Diaphorobacter caeni TaxID=2784387 RepID=UPI00188E7B3B|nr:ankyrin repeat domain-containing protein [Diaphorobacter caeni]MBF5004462.1 ankyrin repeat domain-containing protein [Diaphorobacter caeni]